MCQYFNHPSALVHDITIGRIFSSKALLILGQIASTGNAFRSVSSIIASALAKTSENTECLKFSPTPKFFCQIFVFKGPGSMVSLLCPITLIPFAKHLTKLLKQILRKNMLL